MAHDVSSPTPAPGAPRRAAVSFVKGRHAWRFHFDAGAEALVARAVGDLARRPDSGLTHHDAVVIARQLAACTAAVRDTSFTA